jgi:hypothetical protein
MKKTFTLFLFAAALTTLSSQKFPVKTSALSDGALFKIGVTKQGVYKLTKKNLDDLGVASASINPKEIKIYTNQGGSLPELIAESYKDDLIEMPIIIKGEEDGKFDANDEIVFYAPGVDNWISTANQPTYDFSKNIYSNSHYVFLKISSGNGKRIVPESLTNTATLTLNQNKVSEVYTEDKFNPLALRSGKSGAGKLWVGEFLPKNQVKDFTNSFKFSNYVPTEPLYVKAKVVGRNNQTSNVQLTLGTKVVESYITQVNLDPNSYDYAKETEIFESYIGPNPKISLKHDCVEAWLDYITVNYTEVLNNQRGQTIVRNGLLANAELVKMKLASNDATYAFDISQLDLIKAYEIKNAETIIKGGSNKEYLLYQSGQEYTPQIIGKIANQNLHSLDKLDMIVVYHKNFKAAAEKIVQHRIKHSKLNTKAILVDEIYNEFGSGKVDPTAIRNFIKMLYDRNPSFRYVLLMGDGSYDNRELLTTTKNQSFIPVYESDESLNDIESFPSDDYYGLVSDNEGYNLQGALDIAVGRLTVKSEGEANNLVDKIISYDTNPNRFGEWRLNSDMLADDEDNSLHLRDSDEIATGSALRDPIINQGKIYLDAFNQENTPGGQFYPEVNEAINANIAKGLLTMTYLGHGGPEGFAQERVVRLGDIENWNNKNTPTLFITATCQFAGYDDHTRESGGEKALINPKGGAIALFTTVRSVYADENKRLTNNVFENLYVRENGLASTLGDIMKKAKNKTYSDTTGTNSRKFTLLGDPAQRLALPQHNIEITKINDKPSELFNDTIGAFQTVTIEGSINDYQKNKLTNFNGSLFMTIYDKISKQTTLGNDGARPETFEMYRNILYKGQATVKNGIFTIQCIIPKDINYAVGKTRISMYAHNGVEDAGGIFSNLIVGGDKIGSISKDDKAPEMQLYMNDEKFRNGGLTNSNPKLLVKLRDDIGINITGNSIGHDITAKLIGEGVNNEYVLNDFYKVDITNFKQGVVTFGFNKLKPGKYQVVVKAWDISNNSVTDTIEFTVMGENKDNKILNIYNYPNPFIQNTRITFEHDLVDETVDIHCRIYDISGRLVADIKETRQATGNRVDGILWGGVDHIGAQLSPGLYLGQVTIEAPAIKQSRKSDFFKLIKQI